MPNEENINPNITPDLEPIEGEPGWYFDRNTGQTIHESELGGLFDDEPEDEDWDYEEEDDEDDDRRDNDRREKNDKDDEAQEEENPNPENENNPGEGPEGEPGSNPAGEGMPEGGESLAEGGAEAAGEAGAEAAAEAGAELAAETAAEVAAETAVAEAAAVETAAASEGLLAAYFAASPWSEIITFVVILIIVIVVILSFSLMGYGTEGAYGDTATGSASIVDGERDDLARQVLANTNITYDSDINKTDIDPDKCYTAPIDWTGEKCVQKPVLQLLLALANAGFEVNVSSTIRDHPPSINSTSRHLDGMAVDIGNDAIFLDAMKWMTSNLLDTSIAPSQILCAGADNIYGDGVVVPAIDNLSVDDGKIFPGFTSTYVGDHTNHIHVGY